MMTAREAIKGLERLAKEFSGYKPNEEMFEMAITALEKEAWKEEHPVSPLIYKYPPPSPPKKSNSCMWCNNRMMCDRYLRWLSDATDLAVPTKDDCKHYCNDSN